MVAKQRELNSDEFRKMQLMELDMIVEFDRVCRENNINYVIIAGTMLGAVRHNGYIPWDDDADIGMLREDYERFKEVSSSLDSKVCFFQDHTTDPSYRWGYGKLRRTGTTYIRIGQEHLKCKTGIFVDIFPLDDVPESLLGQMIQDFYCYCCRKILWSEVGRANSTGFMKLWWTLLSHISVNRVYKWLDLYIKKSKNDSPNKVRILCFNAIGKLYFKHPIEERYGMPKVWFREREEYMFEGVKLFGSKDYDTVLKHFYNDYMTPPPVEKRGQHAPVSYIDFGDATVVDK